METCPCDPDELAYGACPWVGMRISETAGRIFSVQSSVESFRLVVVQYHKHLAHYTDVIMSTMAHQIASLTIVYSTVYSDVNQRKHQSSASLAFVSGIHRPPVPFYDVIMNLPHMGCLMGQNTYLKPWMHFIRSKFYGIASTCSCAASWSFARLTHGLAHPWLPIWLMGWNAYLWNRWTEFFCSKFYGIFQTCICKTLWAFPHFFIWPMGHSTSTFDVFHVLSSVEFSRPVIMQRCGILPICLI